MKPQLATGLKGFRNSLVSLKPFRISMGKELLHRRLLVCIYDMFGKRMDYLAYGSNSFVSRYARKPGKASSAGRR